MLGTDGAFISIHGTCAVVFTNNSNDIVTYDWGDFGWLAEWLTDDCLNRRDTTIGVCIFGGSLDRSPYIGFVVPFLFCSRVQLNQLSLLVSLTRLTLAFDSDPE